MPARSILWSELDSQRRNTTSNRMEAVPEGDDSRQTPKTWISGWSTAPSASLRWQLTVAGHDQTVVTACLSALEGLQEEGRRGAQRSRRQ